MYYQGIKLQPETVKDHLKLLRFLWGALLLGLVFHYVALSIVLIATKDTQIETQPLLSQILTLIALILFVLSVTLPKKLLQGARRQLLRDSANASFGSLDILLLIQNYRAPFILKIALLEGISIIGLCVGFIHHNHTYYLPFMAFSIVGFLLAFPTEEKVKNDYL